MLCLTATELQFVKFAMLDSPWSGARACETAQQQEGSFCICFGDVPTVTVSVAPDTLATVYAQL